MRQKKTRKDHVEAAAKAMSDLNMLYAIVALCEGSLFSTDCHSTESRIITFCKSESAKALSRYDRATAAALR